MSDSDRHYEGDHFEFHHVEADTFIAKQVIEGQRAPSFALVTPIWNALREAGLDPPQLEEAHSHLQVLDEQLQLPEPDESLLVKAAAGLKKLGGKVMAVLGSEPVQKVVTAAASEVAKQLVLASWGPH